MIKRTNEKVLVWVGVAFALIQTLLMAISLAAYKNPETIEQLKQALETEIEGVTKDELISIIMSLLQFGIGVLIVATVISVIGVFLIKNRPVLAGVLIIIAAIVVLLVGNLLTMVLWLIAGIMLIVRKPKNAQTAGEDVTLEQLEEKEKDKKDDPYIY